MYLFIFTIPLNLGTDTFFGIYVDVLSTMVENPKKTAILDIWTAKISEYFIHSRTMHYLKLDLNSFAGHSSIDLSLNRFAALKLAFLHLTQSMNLWDRKFKAWKWETLTGGLWYYR